MTEAEFEQAAVEGLPVTAYSQPSMASCPHPIPASGPSLRGVEPGQIYMFKYICPLCGEECIGRGISPPDVSMAPLDK